MLTCGAERFAALSRSALGSAHGGSGSVRGRARLTGARLCPRHARRNRTLSPTDSLRAPYMSVPSPTSQLGSCREATTI
eukprot:5739721-Pyramimonas_sp.AAC.1